MMPDSDHRDEFFYLPLTPMIDPYIIEKNETWEDKLRQKIRIVTEKSIAVGGFFFYWTHSNFLLLVFMPFGGYNPSPIISSAASELRLRRGFA